jgi:hypothetical protein
MEKLEESQRLSEERRRQRAEDKNQQKTESVARPLHKTADDAQAFVSASDQPSNPKQLLS